VEKEITVEINSAMGIRC